MRKKISRARDIWCLLMRFRVCPYPYVGEGSPDKGGGKYLGTCKQHVRLVILVSVRVTSDNRWQEAELKERSKLFAEATKNLCVLGSQKIG